ASATLPSLRYATDIIRGAAGRSRRRPWCPHARGSPLRLGDGDVLRLTRVQDPRHEPRLHLPRVPRHPVQASGRLVERLPPPEDLGRLGGDRPLVLALADVAQPPPGGAGGGPPPPRPAP